ncbi:putative RNA methyltransferase [Alkalimarinus alittae]|uniref:Methyltransferase n=1 Tax=Alkalimarinus alittae TaxID=2961619 RepID=A0ABY6MZ26_9ALTE|nr:methyltransferase [Alkalimarinus alittae]UZE95097.1 methyltransferase [Alkalimarinus alittae]
MTVNNSLICPVCSHSLNRTDKQFSCENNHQFDVAKQGYVNLLQPQHKKSKQPGDSQEMVEARFRFLDGNFYQTISDTLNELILKDYLSKAESSQAYKITDAGSGEGYYTQRLHHCLDTQTGLTGQPVNPQIIGFDISQKAVKASCRRSKSIQWVTATSSHIPVKSHSQDAVLSLFSRIVPDEFSRILKQDGILYVASTGPNHLIELRNKLYQDVKQLAYNPTSTLAEKFTPLEQELSSTIRYKIDINSHQAINDLLLMTPHYWRATESAKATLNTLESLTVSIDIMLTGYRLCQ